ncbi:hypothetical protein [Aeoliella mucimassa]|uniref:Uncharacterized protein n=1 Tax=Aeoliella mucimassa TaxID=2527972 RepID=A0A518ANT3_9BACT|nr:hypothetical protein [Aeoliella mucimassa]QDU56378.1 hypothetical protein Pan181_25870 [Aeoliella mucimassa]
MPRSAVVWLVGCLAILAVLLPIGTWRGDAIAGRAMLAGVGVSLFTTAACIATVSLARWKQQPLNRMLLETCLRMALPVSFLLALAITRRHLLDNTYLLYFLPFQFLTIYAGTVGAIGSIPTKPSKPSDK